MKIEIERKNDDGLYFCVMTVDDTRKFVFDSVDKLMERLGDVLLEGADNAKIPF